MREVRIDEGDFADEGALGAYLAEELDLPAGSLVSLAALEGRLDGICEPTHVTIVRPIWNRATWFDKVSTVFERASGGNFYLTVDVNSEDPADSVEAHASAEAALRRLREGNEQYVGAHHANGDVSDELISRLFEEGQHPFACVISCSDARVVPEHIFMCGLGEIFCIRTAGNIVGPSELASAVYACAHLHTPLLLVLGHTHCGAIDAAMHGGSRGPVGFITSKISETVGEELDPLKAAEKNVRTGMATLSADRDLAALVDAGELEIRGALYLTHSGRVSFLE